MRTSWDAPMDADGLPHVDTHEVVVAAAATDVWAAVERYARDGLGVPPRSQVARLLGTEPRQGFRVVATDPGRSLVLAGRHRFSSYRLEFRLRPAGDLATVLSAWTFAEFPGLPGRVYRGLVIGTGLHALVTNHMLRAIRRLA